MKIFKYFINAFSSFWKNKLRSFLSTLWIIIWIASVSIMMAIWEGVKEMLIKNLSVSNDIITIVKKNDWSFSWNNWKKQNKKDKPYIQVNNIFNEKTLKSIKKYIWNVKYVEAIWNSQVWWEIKFEWKSVYGKIVWITETYLKAKNLEIKSWIWFSKKNYENEDKVVLLWYNFVKSYLKWKNPIGKKLMISWYAFQVIWIMDKSNDYNVNYSILVPITTAQSSLWVKSYDEIYIFVDDIELVQSTKKDASYLLMKLSKVSNPSDVKFTIRSNDEILKEINKSIWMFKLFLGWIAWISLLVWWIWIMNIMLVSVIERTREIWIRKAIWAKKKDILMQFLVESILISIVWCIIAFWITILWVYLINKFGWENIKAIINSSVIVFASGISVFMWIIFWLLPAWKAAKMKPIDALRFE